MFDVSPDRSRFPSAASLALALAVLAAGCVEMFVGPDDESGRLGLAFRLAAEGEATSAAVSGEARTADPSVGPRRSTTVTGSGSAALELHDVRIVVGQFALERNVGDCDGGDLSTCERFVADPHLLALSLGELTEGEAIRVSEPAPADVYRALEFAVRAPGEELLAEIRQEGAEIAADQPDRPERAFADWPPGATLFVSGTYDEDGAAGSAPPVPFRVFFRGEASVDIGFGEDTPLVIRGGETTRATVVMSREVWRASGDGQVADLSQLDYDETGEVFELDPTLIAGFESIEIGG